MFFRASIQKKTHTLWPKKQEFFVLLWDAQKSIVVCCVRILFIFVKKHFFSLVSSRHSLFQSMMFASMCDFFTEERGSNPRRVNLHHTNKILNRLNIQLVDRLDRVWDVFFSLFFTKEKLAPPPAFFPFPTDKKNVYFLTGRLSSLGGNFMRI